MSELAFILQVVNKLEQTTTIQGNSPALQNLIPLRSSQQNLRNLKHLLTICWAARSFLQPPPLPVNHFVNYSPIWLENWKRRQYSSSFVLWCYSMYHHRQVLWYLKIRVFRQRKRTNCALAFTCFLQPRWLLNPSCSHTCIGQWYKLSVSSFFKWSRFGFGDEPSIFDQSTLPFLFTSDICVIYTVCSTNINSEQNT